MILQFIIVFGVLVIGSVIGALIYYISQNRLREEIKLRGFSEEEVDEELGTGHGFLHFIKHC